jgi:hypothetical protein
MTSLAQGNTVFWNSIFLHIIDVMDDIAILATNSTNILVAFANKSFEIFIKGCWIGFKRYTAKPHITVLPSFRVRTLLGMFHTTINFLSARINCKFLTTIWAFARLLSPHPSSCFTSRSSTITARAGTKITNFVPIWRNKIFFSTKPTNFSNFNNTSINGCVPLDSRYCCSGNTGQTGRIRNKITDLCICLNNSIIS